MKLPKIRSGHPERPPRPCEVFAGIDYCPDKEEGLKCDRDPTGTQVRPVFSMVGTYLSKFAGVGCHHQRTAAAVSAGLVG
jgi:hypothetical protein